LGNDRPEKKEMSVSKRLLTVATVLIGILIFGVAGYMLVEGWNLMDALYMTIITIGTVGFAEVHPMDSAGRIFTIFLIVLGSGSALYALTTIVQFVMEGRLGSALWRRNMKNRINHLKNHFILCGYGRVGQEVARILSDEKAEFVILDKNREAITQAELDNHLYVMADAASDEALKEAGIERARGLIVALGNDADSTYVILSARQLNPNIFIEARVSAPEAEGKLKRAGANRVISPYSIGARRMAMLALQPEVADFIDIISFKGQELHLENLTVGKGSPLAEKTVGEARQRSKANVLAINKNKGKLLANPSDMEKIQAGDGIIAMGTRGELRAMEGICESCKLEE
jgi:voltage-gated potassium channel